MVHAILLFLQDVFQEHHQGSIAKLLGHADRFGVYLNRFRFKCQPHIEEFFDAGRLLNLVAFDTRDVRQAISDGVSGLLIPTPDSGLLADAILSLLHDSTMAENLGRAGHLHSETTFSITNVVDNLEIIYLEATTRIRA